MSRREDIFVTPPQKKLRFRGDSSLNHNLENSQIEEIFDTVDSKTPDHTNKNGNVNKLEEKKDRHDTPSLYDFVKVELTRGYVLEHDEERYSARREKIYTFMRIPREVEQFMIYGFLQCADSFLYIHTFLPIRYVLALCALIYRPIAKCFGYRRTPESMLTPAEKCDLLKGTIWIMCTTFLILIDTNRMYHVVKSQSIIKLYIFYNMLEVGDRLLSAFGQDTIDALFWTATEPRKGSHRLSVIGHICFAAIYVAVHSVLIMFQAITLNVAINSNNKGLLTIMMSNNFVELKGSVFKKFDKNNLFQLTCSDVRERFNLTILMSIVILQTMKEFNWSSEQLFVMLPDCTYIFLTEIMVDWIKHAFITRFNELPIDVYKEYTVSLAYDMTQTRQKNAFSDHSDLVARRMGFIPFPLSVILVKAIYHSITFNNTAILLFIFGFILLLMYRTLIIIYALGKACDLMKKHKEEKNTLLMNNSSGVSVLGGTPQSTSSQHQQQQQHGRNSVTTDTASSPVHFYPLQRSQTVNVVVTEHKTINEENNLLPNELGATALFSNSDVGLDDICLNEKVLNTNIMSDVLNDDNFIMTRSFPDLDNSSADCFHNSTSDYGSVNHRTHKRSESEPSIQSAHMDSGGGGGVNTSASGGGGGGNNNINNNNVGDRS